ncbi:MAG TPA: hypothetical protein VFW68_09780 [Rhodocyclaceae bacterium]|nr:hypothetical protein [Rhodocyclaceae bacterium]
MRRWLCLMLGTTWFAASAAYAVESRGARSCASWQSGRLAENEGYSRMAEINQTWLVGYMSGLVAGSGLDFLVGTDNPTVFAMVDDYCVSTPAGNLATAGVAVARQLMQDKGLVYRGTMP